MVRVHDILKRDGYDIITFTDGKEAYGMLLCGEYVEFMEFDNNDTVSITENDNPEEFKRLKDKYFEFVMEYIKTHGN